MKITTEHSFNVDEKEWDDNIKQTKSSTAFQSARNFIPYQQAFNSKPIFLTTTDSKGKILLQLSAVIHENVDVESEGLFQRFFSKIKTGKILYWNYGPIIHEHENHNIILENALEKIDQIALNEGISTIKGGSPIFKKSTWEQSFKKFDYALQPWDTWVTDLQQNEDILYKSLHNKTRYDVRKGEKNNLSFEIVNTRETLDDWMKIKFSNRKNKDSIFKRLEKFNDSTWDILYKSGLEKMYLTRKDNEIVGGIANKLFNNNAVQHSIINSTKTKLQGGSFLTWNTIKWSLENNFISYDMGGANPSPISKKEEGIQRFKSKWAGTYYRYFLFTKIVDKKKKKIKQLLSFMK